MKDFNIGDLSKLTDTIKQAEEEVSKRKSLLSHSDKLKLENLLSSIDMDDKDSLEKAIVDIKNKIKEEEEENLKDKQDAK
jgi:acyl-CoA-binding protein